MVCAGLCLGCTITGQPTGYTDVENLYYFFFLCFNNPNKRYILVLFLNNLTAIMVNSAHAHELVLLQHLFNVLFWLDFKTVIFQFLTILSRVSLLFCQYILGIQQFARLQNFAIGDSLGIVWEMNLDIFKRSIIRFWQNQIREHQSNATNNTIEKRYSRHWERRFQIEIRFLRREHHYIIKRGCDSTSNPTDPDSDLNFDADYSDVIDIDQNIPTSKALFPKDTCKVPR